MDGIHDLGGQEGFGRVVVEVDEPVFHGRWEAKVFAMLNSVLRLDERFNVDYFRHAVERIDPICYLTQGYYGRWLGAAETMLVEAGLLSQEEIQARAEQMGVDPNAAVAARPQPSALPQQASQPSATAQRAVSVAPRYAVGDAVLTLAQGHRGHTRLPAYARNKWGRVVAAHDGWVFPDQHAQQGEEAPQHLYTVAFDGTTLWGEGSEPGITVCLDLFESYLRAG